MSKKTKKIVLSVFAGLLIAFCIHFYIVTKPEKQTGPMIQLARIDFKQHVDSMEAGKIASLVKHLEGVNNTYFNIPDGILIYGYDVNSKQTTDNVFKQVMALNNYKAEKYVVDPKTLAGGCPIMNPNSFSYRFYLYYKKVFNKNSI